MNQKEPVDITKDELESVKDKGPAIVDFWAEWCGACKQMEPVINSLAGDYGDDVFFAKLNVGEDREAALEYQISSIPTILFFKDGELVDRIIGTVPKKELEEKIEEMIE